MEKAIETVIFFFVARSSFHMMRCGRINIAESKTKLMAAEEKS
jgi:hypothetical protein